MSSLAVPNIECIESGNNYGRFLVEPLEKGFGNTIGNALRRVLLSYISGVAITGVRIEGIQHEFTPIPGVKEDVLEFLLNVKALSIKALSNRAGMLVLEKKDNGEVRAADIKPSVDFEIVNPELYLATLDSTENGLYIEFDVEIGIGYRPAGLSDNLPAGTIPVDAIFAPVRQVNFTIEPAHLGRETSRERLNLEVWTNGTIAPVDAISKSASILIEQIMPFVDYSRVSQIAEEKEALRAAISDDVFNMPVEQLNLSVRAMNCLRRSGINTVGELISTDVNDLMSLRNFGEKSKNEIDEKLAELGLSFNPTLSENKDQVTTNKSQKSKEANHRMGED
ncbi:MAG: DNA-directed RNA polymerase subunit alpha [Dehalococcoidia bacterium]|nr:MAG: DNA-directed RNA polymerase subunit alpha [Dehalococcoidia bacterium]